MSKPFDPKDLKVDDIVEMKYGIADQRIVGIYPMNNIISPDRVDIAEATCPDDDHFMGIPVEWIKGKK